MGQLTVTLTLEISDMFAYGSTALPKTHQQGQGIEGMSKHWANGTGPLFWMAVIQMVPNS